MGFCESRYLLVKKPDQRHYLSGLFTGLPAVFPVRLAAGLAGGLPTGLAGGLSAGLVTGLAGGALCVFEGWLAGWRRRPLSPRS